MAFMVSVESVRSYLQEHPPEGLDEDIRRNLAERVRADIDRFAESVERLRRTQGEEPDQLGLGDEMKAAQELLTLLETSADRPSARPRRRA
jgi:hypothetical protein